MASPTREHFYINAFNSISLLKNYQNPIYQLPSPTSDHAFPMLAIAMLSIVVTAFLLVAYYFFVNKFCFNRHQVMRLLLRWFSIWRAQQNEDSFIALSPAMWNRGLDEAIIREIPTIQYRRGGDGGRSVYGCVVCLNEFQEEDLLRVLPKCSHAFHLDCIDIWFQSNANCPLCRTSISGTNTRPLGCIVAPMSSPQSSHPYTDSLMGGDEDFVVIELGGEDEEVNPHHRPQERDISERIRTQPRVRTRSQSPLKIEQKSGKLKSRKCQNLSMMGDECIDVRGEEDDQFSIQPIRRSFSLDSAVDRQLYVSVQEIIQQKRREGEIHSTTEESSNRVRRSFFPFSHGRISRNAVLPVDF